MLDSPFVGFDKLSFEGDQQRPVNLLNNLTQIKTCHELFTNLIKTKKQSSVNTKKMFQA